LKVKKVDRILFFVSGRESEIGMYGIKVLVDCTEINEFGVIYDENVINIPSIIYNGFMFHEVFD
jgi:hypothetical protein